MLWYAAGVPEAVSKVVWMLAGAAVSLIWAEATRLRRKLRLLMRSAKLPAFVLSVKDDHASIRLTGEYVVINLSDIPIHLRRPHLLGYSLASRAFQFKVAPMTASLEAVFEEFSIPSNSEAVLISEKACATCVERFLTRAMPAFFWLETLELVRIGPHTHFRHRATLYRRWHCSHVGDFWYHNVGIDVSATTARLLALPGKTLLRWRRRPMGGSQAR